MVGHRRTTQFYRLRHTKTALLRSNSANWWRACQNFSSLLFPDCLTDWWIVWAKRPETGHRFGVGRGSTVFQIHSRISYVRLSSGADLWQLFRRYGVVQTHGYGQRLHNFWSRFRLDDVGSACSWVLFRQRFQTRTGHRGASWISAHGLDVQSMPTSLWNNKISDNARSPNTCDVSCIRKLIGDNIDGYRTVRKNSLKRKFSYRRRCPVDMSAKVISCAMTCVHALAVAWKARLARIGMPESTRAQM